MHDTGAVSIEKRLSRLMRSWGGSLSFRWTKTISWPNETRRTTSCVTTLKKSSNGGSSWLSIRCRIWPRLPETIRWRLKTFKRQLEAVAEAARHYAERSAHAEASNRQMVIYLGRVASDLESSKCREAFASEEVALAHSRFVELLSNRAVIGKAV
jgi:hypothetical protein